MGSIAARAGAILGPTLALLILIVGPPEGTPVLGWRTLAVLAWMTTWWVLQPVPLAATALLPLVLFPLLGVLDVSRAAAPYASSVVFLLLGGFMLARAVERSGLQRRIARRILGLTSGSVAGLLTGVMAATAALGMWMSISATALLMMPLALTLVGPARQAPTRAQTALVLAVPYAAAIAATATLVATPPIALLASTIESSHGVDVTFARWLLVGGSVAALGLSTVWLLLRREAGRSAAPLPSALDALGPWTTHERRAALLVAGVIVSWLVGPLFGIDEAVVAISGGIIAFLLPAGSGRARILEASDIPRFGWPILLLVGGGLSLGHAATSSGLADEVVGALSVLAAWPPLLALLLLAGATVAISEMSSNTATAAALLPLAGPLGEALGISSVTVVTTLALASCAGFAMPVGTPPNAIAFGTGMVPLRRMIRLGIMLDAAFAILAVVGGLIADKLL